MLKKSEAYPKILNVNGFNILYINNNKNISSIHAYLNIGSIQETKKLSGIMHLIEHMIIDSWKKCNNSCGTYWSKKSAMINAQTSATFTRFFIIGLNNGNQKEMYEYICSILTEPKFTEKCMERCKKAVVEELKNNVNEHSWKLDSEFYKMIDDNTEYKGYCRILDYNLKIKNLENITLNNIKECYKKWYNKFNIFFSVVTNESEKIVKKHFDNYIKINEINEDIGKPINVYLLKNRCLIKPPKNITQTTYCIGFIKNNPNPNIYIYKDLIRDILVGDVSSLMFLKLRDELNLVYGIDMTYEFGRNYIITRFKNKLQFF